MRYRFAFLVGIYLVAAPGCYFHGGYPYGPYGTYGPGPSVLPAQPMNGYPSGPTYQPGSPIYQPGTPIYQPGGPTPLNGPYTPTTPGGVPSGDPLGVPSNSNPPTTYPQGGNAPPFTTTPGGGNRVPDPIDDGGFNRQPGAQRPTITPTSGQKLSDDDNWPSTQNSNRSTRPVNEQSVADNDAFEPPVRQVSGSDDDFANDPPIAQASKAYAHDAAFKWIQGVVEYDQASGTWLITYDDNPPTSDRLGGVLTLSDDPSLDKLRDGNIVRFEGSVDRNSADSRGKPQFRFKVMKIMAK